MPSESHLYNEAGQLYCKVAAGHCNLKNGLFQSNFTTDLKKLLAIVAEAIKNKAIINEIFKRAIRGRIEIKEGGRLECEDGTGCMNCKTKVMIYDMLLGRAMSNTSGCPLVSKLRFYRNILEEMMKELKFSTTEEIIAHFRPADNTISLPVYVRVNTLLTTKQAVIEHFVSKGYNYLDYEDKSVKYNQFLEWAKQLGRSDFMPDYHMHDTVLVFHPGVQLHADRLVRSRHALIQDKASCIPAAVLAPCGSMDVLDACAAPGNKTTQLLALLAANRQANPESHSSPPPTLFAFDRSETRFKLLQSALRVYTADGSMDGDNVAIGPEGVLMRARLEDFSRVDPTAPEYARVGYICLDPSCSGSGIMRQIDRVAERAAPEQSRVDPGRLQALRNFQAMLLAHALSFPSARTVVYSTCSVTVDENEAVVAEALERHAGEWALRSIWPDSWLTRGKKTLKECLRTSPAYDLCNGFFVACFDRVGPHVPRPRASLPPPGARRNWLVKAEQQPAIEEADTAGKHYRKRRKTKKTGKKARENLARRLERDATGHNQTDQNPNIKSTNEVKEEMEVDRDRKKKRKFEKEKIAIEQTNQNVDPEPATKKKKVKANHAELAIEQTNQNLDAEPNTKKKKVKTDPEMAIEQTNQNVDPEPPIKKKKVKANHVEIAIEQTNQNIDTEPTSKKKKKKVKTDPEEIAIEQTNQYIDSESITKKKKVKKENVEEQDNHILTGQIANKEQKTKKK